MLALNGLDGVHLAAPYVVIYRHRSRQWWTTGRLADLAPARATPVSVLVSERTFSSGEALAYHLQSQGRARLVGQRTPGAADYITPVRLSGHVRALLPEARVRDAVTGTKSREWCPTSLASRPRR